MKFGIFYEHQLPKPWKEGLEQQLFQDALDQVELADKLGIDYAWEVEHHFLEEYSHSSSPEIFLAAASQRTKNIRLGHGIRQVISNYNHPARTAECIATLDLVSNGRVEFGTGESSAILELGGFDIPVESKREQYLEAVEQICNMLAMDPYPGFEGKYFSMPCRNIVPKPAQRPHPPLWVACSNRETIKMAARLGIGALTFAFVDPMEAKHWVDEYYSIIKSDECVPIGHTVNANIAMVTSFSLHQDREEAVSRGLEGFEFFGYALGALYGFGEHKPGRTNLFKQFREVREKQLEEMPLDVTESLIGARGGIGTPDDMRGHLKKFEAVGVDQVTFIQQAGMNKHEHICESLELFASEVMPEFKAREAEREAKKTEELAPFIEAALARKEFMPTPDDKDIPVFPALGRSIVEGEADPSEAAQA
ncbi:LLM class flavin-dependent oxidoreductase [Gammaproteobacteria bacterium]|nr:LLM class flavin-dependent oxidoreductase [Gammaproteobacteria bacterium]